MELDPKELKIDVFGSGYVNENPSGVRVTHVPTGAQVMVKIYKWQTKNREVAVNVLEVELAKLFPTPKETPADD